MKARELKEKFINFFVSKNHVEIPSSSIIPENDSTTLFISAGMHPLVPYLLGQSHTQGKKLVNVQKCIRTGDIDEVGDKFHHTFFEMLGNWSLGDYFKKDMIPWSFEFLTKHLNYKLEQIHVTCFEGDENSPKDTESHDLWLAQGIPENQIHYLPKKDNWWGPAGTVGPCGPDTEMFIDLAPENGSIDFETGCKTERIVEIGNDVFMQYNKTAEGKYESLSQKNVDTGYGVERNVAIINGFTDDYLTDIWQPIIKKIEEISGKKYLTPDQIEHNVFEGVHEQITKSMRIITDHIRSAVFIIADGIEPSNKEAGYVLRRLIRRSIRHGKMLEIENNFIVDIAKAVITNQNNYAGIYPELNSNENHIYEVLETEENKFRRTLNNGLREIHKYLDQIKNKKENSNWSLEENVGIKAFYFYESFGFPIEMLIDELNAFKIKFDLDKIYEVYNSNKELHQKQSQTLSAGKFKSGLADNSEIITKYHTATHLLHAALRQVLGDYVQQSGSNITSQRLRFDFSHGEKLTDDQLKKVVDLVNEQIQKKVEVKKETMLFVDAQKQGALAFFGNKYPETVSVFTIGNFSKEVCTGPHVDNTSVLGKFEIQKEESAGSGKRRIYAVLK